LPKSLLHIGRRKHTIAT